MKSLLHQPCLMRLKYSDDAHLDGLAPISLATRIFVAMSGNCRHRLALRDIVASAFGLESGLRPARRRKSSRPATSMS